MPPTTTTMARLANTISRAIELRPDLEPVLQTAVDYLEWATTHGLATDLTWQDLTACVAAAAIA